MEYLTEENLPTTNKPSIVLDGVFFQFRDPSGIARVWSALLEQWSDTPFGQSLLVLDRDGAAPKFSGINYLPFNSYHSSHAASESFFLEDLCRQRKAKIFISTFFTTPLETPSVMLVHDMIPERLSCNELWCVEKRFNTYHASGFIAVSHKTAQDLHEDYPATKNAPLCIAYNGVSARFRPVPSEVVQAFKNRYGISQPYFLCVGRRNSYKNGQLFFSAFAGLPDNQGISIVCCGGHQTLEPGHRTCVEEKEVHMLTLSDEELNAAYAGALALVYPSKYEGFGLPILEAMSAGCPVITCPNTSIPEVAGDAALYVNDSDINGMLRSLINIQRQEIREPLIQAGLQRSRLFSWSKTAQLVGSFLTDMANNHALLEERRSASHKHWRELRTYERQCETAPERLQELLRRPELQSHIESVWLKSIAEENLVKKR